MKKIFIIILLFTSLSGIAQQNVLGSSPPGKIITVHGVVAVSPLSITTGGNVDTIQFTGSASSALSGLTAATATNNINNVSYKQKWDWNSLAGDTAFFIRSNNTTAASNAQVGMAIGLLGANATSTQTTTGLSISNTHTGTSSTNIGLNVSATGGSTNYAALFGQTVGIGLTPTNTNYSLYLKNSGSLGLAIEGTVSANPVLDFIKPTSGQYNTIGFYTATTRNYYIAHAPGNILQMVNNSGVGITIGSSGQVGISQSSPSSSFLLDVGAAARVSYTSTVNSGTVVPFTISPTYNQTVTPTTSNKDFVINRTETALGSGEQDFIDMQIATASKFRIDNKAHIFTDATNTATGTTGSQTINKPSGKVNFAAGASTLVVTNSLVSTSSIVLVTVEGTDATFISARVTLSSGSFTITANAAATAETKVDFWVIN